MLCLRVKEKRDSYALDNVCVWIGWRVMSEENGMVVTGEDGEERRAGQRRKSIMKGREEKWKGKKKQV